MESLSVKGTAQSLKGINQPYISGAHFQYLICRSQKGFRQGLCHIDNFNGMSLSICWQMSEQRRLPEQSLSSGGQACASSAARVTDGSSFITFVMCRG
jgi:hypothetical protein